MNIFAIGCLAISLAACGVYILILAFIDEKKSECEKGDNENEF